MNLDMLPASQARRANADYLSRALTGSRAQTLRSAAAYVAALPGLSVPQRAELNPPLWELGHVGWFQEWWIARNRQVGAGASADPLAARPPSRLKSADMHYDSSNVVQSTRWSLDLPDTAATLDYLESVLESSKACLLDAPEEDDGLYFFRLCLFHEDMHNEAAIYMAHSLGFGVPDAREAAPCRAGTIALPGATHRLGWSGPGFAFDNEIVGREVALEPCEIDLAPVDNAHFAAFVDAGGYAEAKYWSAAGRAWLADSAATHPRFWRRTGSRWQQSWFGQWRDLDPRQPALNLTCFEAEAWCAWAGRRLPSEAEWECAATTAATFQWGDVWEWSADEFQPYPGFVAHPYRDYSAPWFGSRRVLRGGSVATHARMQHPRYRNFFTAERCDIFAGFRSCAL